MQATLIATATVLVAGIGTLVLGLTAPTAPLAANATGTGTGALAPVVPAQRVLDPVVPGTTWTTDPFTLTRLGERQGARLPFPPPPPVTLPPLPTMPFRQAP